MYAQALSETDLEYSTLTKAKWVSSQIEICRRRQSLTHAHHSEVASLEPKEQDKWLDRAESEGLTVKELRQEIRDAKRKNRVAIWPRPGQAKVAVLACSIYTQRSAPPRLLSMADVR